MELYEFALIRIFYKNGTHKTRLIPAANWYRNQFAVNPYRYSMVERVKIVKRPRKSITKGA